MTEWEEHLLYRSDRKADRHETTARISRLAADGWIGPRKSLTLPGFFRRVTGFRQVILMDTFTAPDPAERRAFNRLFYRNRRPTWFGHWVSQFFCW